MCSRCVRTVASDTVRRCAMSRRLLPALASRAIRSSWGVRRPSALRRRRLPPLRASSVRAYRASAGLGPLERLGYHLGGRSLLAALAEQPAVGQERRDALQRQVGLLVQRERVAEVVLCAVVICVLQRELGAAERRCHAGVAARE